eukprot:jgi/Ulvmu1/2308/UM013_0156.1
MFARANTATQAASVSAGGDFGCTSTTILAEAWAEAFIDCHAAAVAAAAERCECLRSFAGSHPLSVRTPGTFLTLIADSFALAEVVVCTGADAEVSAAAYADCAASAYATVGTTAIADEFLKGGCWPPAVFDRLLAEIRYRV